MFLGLAVGYGLPLRSSVFVWRSFIVRHAVVSFLSVVARRFGGCGNGFLVQRCFAVRCFVLGVELPLRAW